MADITLKDITPIHFLNAVRLLKMDDYRVYCTIDTIEIRFESKRFYTRQESDLRFDLCEHVAAFLTELRNSSVPIDKMISLKCLARFPQEEDFSEENSQQFTGYFG